MSVDEDIDMDCSLNDTAPPAKKEAKSHVPTSANFASSDNRAISAVALSPTTLEDEYYKQVVLSCLLYPSQRLQHEA